MPPPEVYVSAPVTQQVTEYEDFPGQTQAIPTIEVRARVSGYLADIYFKDGAEVKKDDPLFEIDPRPYKAQLDQDQADFANKKAMVTKTGALYQRTVSLRRSSATSQEEIDNQKGDWEVARAAVGQAEAKVRMSQLNLNWTKVKAPISGRISRRLIDPGNMVKADETPLSTIVSLDPIYANFDVDEANALRLIRLGKIQALRQKTGSSLNQPVDVFLGLADEEGFPHPGTIDFVDNQIDANTGTLRMRGVFPNPDRVLSPGLFVRIRLPMGAPHTALLVAEQALGRDQGQKFVFVVGEEIVTDENGDSKVRYPVRYRRVKVGRLYDGQREAVPISGARTISLLSSPLGPGPVLAASALLPCATLREITDGLRPGEKIVVSGLQRIRDGGEVKPKVVDMLAPGQEAIAANR
jgi:RND family efflux transporter MFP subunit